MKFESWNDVFGKDKLNRTRLSKTKVFSTPEEAIYHGVILGSKNGAYDRKQISKIDGSLKPFNYNEASTEDRELVKNWIKDNN